MAKTNTTLRRTCLAIAIVGLAIAAAPTAAAICVPDDGGGPYGGACWQVDPFHPDGEYVCITNKPIQNCGP